MCYIEFRKWANQAKYMTMHGFSLNHDYSSSVYDNAFIEKNLIAKEVLNFINKTMHLTFVHLWTIQFKWMFNTLQEYLHWIFISSMYDKRTSQSNIPYEYFNSIFHMNIYGEYLKSIIKKSIHSYIYFQWIFRANNKDFAPLMSMRLQMK